MYPIALFQGIKTNDQVIAEAQAMIDASPFRGLVGLMAEDTFVEVDDEGTVTHERDDLSPYELAMVDRVDRHDFRLWRRRRAYRAAWIKLAHKLADMRVCR